MFKFLLKIWPAFLPILAYIFWIYIVERMILSRLLQRKKIIDGEFQTVGEKSTESGAKDENKKQKANKFSLQNRQFVIALYISFILAILTLITAAFKK